MLRGSCLQKKMQDCEFNWRCKWEECNLFYTIFYILMQVIITLKNKIVDFYYF